MITVVVPTMWKFKPFINFLADLTNVPSIGQITIIDNNPSERPDADILFHSKIDYITFGKNIYVNPAWNIGTQRAQFENVCLLNDDVIVDLKLFHRMDAFLRPGIGLCGICPGLKEEFGQTPITTGEIELEHCKTPYSPRTHFGLGTLMFYPKSEYIPIIDGLDLYWGDNFIYDTLYFKLNQNYHITNTFYYTPYAVTTSTLTQTGDILNREHRIYNTHMPMIIEELRKQNSHITGFNY